MSSFALNYSEAPLSTESMPPHVLKAHSNLLSKPTPQTSPPPPSTNKTHTGLSHLPTSPYPPGTKVLLHSCCAPCSGAMVTSMIDQGLDVTIFFYNPNIHPKKEYNIRLEENKRYALKNNIPFIEADYDVDNWHERAKGMEWDAERGSRCTMCFDMRMERTSLYAYEHGFSVTATTNATSRWKDKEQVNDSGLRCAKPYSGVEYWLYDWASDEMTIRKYQISASERFYKQEYCGCGSSLRDSNAWRKANSIPPIKIGGETAGLGDRYFSNAEIDAKEEDQDVVDEFFKAAESFACKGEERKEQLKIYQERRKNEKNDGNVEGMNNW